MAKSILLLENIHEIAELNLKQRGFQVTRQIQALNEDDLLTALKSHHALGIRSKTKVTKKVLEANPQLEAIGCYCIGTNQVDLSTAESLGIPVFNAPHSNTRSVAELVLAEMICLARQLGDRSSLAHQGKWLKSAEGSHEIRGKTLGIVGYGHIGSQVSVLAESMGVRVLFYDIVKKLPLGNAQVVNDFRSLLQESDFVTMHVPETPVTRWMMGKEQFAAMKEGSFFINASRGSVVVVEDLVEVLRKKHLGGCAIDVFPEEPNSNKESFESPLQGLDNVILTPHIGGSTEEAQQAIGVEVSDSFARYLLLGVTSGAVNFPNVELPGRVGLQRFTNVHRNEPGVLREINAMIARAGGNIEAQYLSTSENIGYLVTDMKNTDSKLLVAELVKLENSIRTSML